MRDIEARQKLEIEYWRDSRDESPESDSLHNIVNKVSDAEVFLSCLNRLRAILSVRGRVLEIGAGQGWASCVYKRLFPDVHITATDISEFACRSLPKWERLFEVAVDRSYACTSYETREQDASLDQVFCYAAAHHFVAHKRTLRELYRILKPGGRAIYFHEPATPRYLYSLAYRRVNKAGHAHTPEDVLITSELRVLAREIGFDLEVDYYPTFVKRRPLETIYYFILGRIPVLQRLLPCTANFIFTKKRS